MIPHHSAPERKRVVYVRRRPAHRPRYEESSRFQPRTGWLLPVLALLLLGAGFILTLPILSPVQSQAQMARGNTSSGGGTTLPGAQHPPPPVYAQAAYMLDMVSGAVLYSKNASIRLTTYSTVKLMTALVVVRSSQGKLDREVEIDNGIQRDFVAWLSADSSLMGIRAGARYTLRDLLYGLLLPSGNDAGVALADAVSGSVPAFVAQMNRQALDMGLHDTHFTNPTGLYSSDQYTSAHDLALLGKVALSDETIRQMSATRHFDLASTTGHPSYALDNGNQLLWWYPGVEGGKTGYDGSASFNQVEMVARNNRHLIVVVLGARDWWTDMRDLLSYGSGDYTWVSPRQVLQSGRPVIYSDLWHNFTSDTEDQTLPLPDGGRYYSLTGYSISGSIEQFFQAQGGLPRFGFPIAPPQSTNGSLLQRFQRGSISCTASTLHCSILP